MNLIAAKVKVKKDFIVPKVFDSITFSLIKDKDQAKVAIHDKIKELKDNVDSWTMFCSTNQFDASKESFRITLLSDIEDHQKEIFPSSEFIILYAGGGGFLANLQTFQETFLKKWSKKIKVPIFQLQYSLSPKFKYPYQVVELLNMYLLIYLQYTVAQKQEKLKIILMGDSAGGNLVLSLMNLLIKFELPLPVQLYCIYPPTNMNPRRFSPSMLHSLDDTVMYFTVAKTCFDAYMPESGAEYETDWLLSPILAPPEILAKYPKTYFMIGELDSFKDDSIRMAYKLLKLGVDSNLVEVQGVKHGFLGYQLPFGLGVDEVQKLHTIIQEYLIVAVSEKPMAEPHSIEVTCVAPGITGNTELVSAHMELEHKTLQVDDKPDRLHRGLSSRHSRV